MAIAKQMLLLSLAARVVAEKVKVDGELTYWKISGRAELTRLVAAAGGVELPDRFLDGPMVDASRPPPWINISRSAGFFGNIPIFRDGNLSLAQSVAIESYIADIAPRYADLTPAQRAIDMFWATTLEDMIVFCGDPLVRHTVIPKLYPDVVEKCKETFTKFLPVLEKHHTPDSGFIHQKGFPTMGDLTVLNFVESEAPFGMAQRLAGYDIKEKHPKLAALASRTKADPAVAEYLSRTETFHAKIAPRPIIAV